MGMFDCFEVTIAAGQPINHRTQPGRTGSIVKGEQRTGRSGSFTWVHWRDNAKVEGFESEESMLMDWEVVG